MKKQGQLYQTGQTVAKPQILYLSWYTMWKRINNRGDLKGIRQLPINGCISSLMIYKITPSVDHN